MIKNNIRMENSTTYTNIPWPIIDKAKKWLEKEKIEYKILTQDEIPADLPQGATFLGKTSYRHVGCIQSKMNSEDLIKICEELFYIPIESI